MGPGLSHDAVAPHEAPAVIVDLQKRLPRPIRGERFKGLGVEKQHMEQPAHKMVDLLLISAVVIRDVVLVEHHIPGQRTPALGI